MILIPFFGLRRRAAYFDLIAPCLRASAGVTFLLGWAVAEDITDTGTEKQVKYRDDGHHEDNEREHDERVTHKLLSGRGDDLLHLDHHLAKEETQARKRSTLLGAIHLGVGDDVLTGFVD